jgi:uncharacterized protein YlaN (UPF0358 family)
MKYFLHDTNAFSDEKITMLYMQFGFEAVGLFYVILEKLALQEKPVRENVLKTQLNIKKRLQKQLDFMYEIDILSVKNGEVFNENLANYSEKYKIKKEKTRKRVSEWRDKQKDTESVTRYNDVRNSGKVKESKVKESNYKTTLLSDLKKSDVPNREYFEITIAFWELFKKNILEVGGSTTTIDKAKGTWIDHIRLLIESDKQNIISVRTVFAYLQKDIFWKKNILSTATLRKQFNKLLLSANSDEKNRQGKQQPATSDQELKDILSKHFD